MTVRSQDILLRRPKLAQFFLGQLTNASTTLYTAPSAYTVANAVGIDPIAVVDKLWVSNTTAGAITVTFYVVESGGAVADNRALMKAVSIPANSAQDIDPGWVIKAGGTLRGLASANTSITVLASGTEYV